MSCSICYCVPEVGDQSPRVFRLYNTKPHAKFPSSACSHKFCMDCIKHYVSDKLALHTKRVICPIPRCGVEIPNSDLRYIAEEEYIARETAAKLYKGYGDPKFARYACQEAVQTCPSCGAWVEKTDGCNHIACSCGAHFCYVCGGHMSNGYFHDLCEKQCGRCFEYGHGANRCRSKRAVSYCTLCYASGHNRSRCQNKLDYTYKCPCGQRHLRQYNVRCPVKYCDGCKAYGHASNHCPLDLVCSICHKTGHRTVNCARQPCTATELCSISQDHTVEWCPENSDDSDSEEESPVSAPDDLNVKSVARRRRLTNKPVQLSNVHDFTPRRSNKRRRYRPTTPIVNATCEDKCATIVVDGLVANVPDGDSFAEAFASRKQRRAKAMSQSRTRRASQRARQEGLKLLKAQERQDALDRRYRQEREEYYYYGGHGIHAGGWHNLHGGGGYPYYEEGGEDGLFSDDSFDTDIDQYDGVDVPFWDDIFE